VIGIAALARLTQVIMPSFMEGARRLRRPSDPTEPEDIAADMYEFVTVATFDKVIDAHIAMGRLSAEGIEARLFDENMVQVASAIALGGIKLRVTRGDEKAARVVLETDYSKTLEDTDLGKRED